MEPGHDFIGPRSKRDRTLPFTYEGWVDILRGQGGDPVWDHYFSDTLCGLIEVMANRDIGPGHVRLFGIYQGKQTLLDSSVVTDTSRRWLERPELCRALEKHYTRTGEECYRGHVEGDICAFADRDRTGMGPVW